MRLRLLSILFIACALGCAAYFVWGRGGGSSFGAEGAHMAAPSDSFKPHRTPPQGQEEFYDQQYRFSVLYPNTLSVQTYDEGGGASTISFQDAATATGFQIFITPYSSSTVSAARFAQDEPSGVRQNPLDIKIDGAAGSSFYGKDQVLGDTAEIWFIHEGYLYEVTAPKSQAQWLADIMATWQFI